MGFPKLQMSFKARNFQWFSWIKPSLILVIVVTLSGVLRGESRTLSLDDVYEKMTRKYETMNYYQANFIQKNYWKVQDLKMESTGTMFISGEKMAIVFRNPPGQKLVADEVLYLIDDIDKTIIITTVDHTGGMFNPIDIIDFYWSSSRKEMIVEEETGFLITLIPENDPYTAMIELRIRAADFIITSVAYQDFQQNRVEFNLHGEKINQPFDRGIFEVVLDDDYTIIDNRNLPPFDLTE